MSLDGDWINSLPPAALKHLNEVLKLIKKAEAARNEHRLPPAASESLNEVVNLIEEAKAARNEPPNPLAEKISQVLEKRVPLEKMNMDDDNLETELADKLTNHEPKEDIVARLKQGVKIYDKHALNSLMDEIISLQSGGGYKKRRKSSKRKSSKRKPTKKRRRNTRRHRRR